MTMERAPDTPLAAPAAVDVSAVSLAHAQMRQQLEAQRAYQAYQYGVQAAQAAQQQASWPYYNPNAPVWPPLAAPQGPLMFDCLL